MSALLRRITILMHAALAHDLTIGGIEEVPDISGFWRVMLVHRAYGGNPEPYLWTYISTRELDDDEFARVAGMAFEDAKALMPKAQGPQGWPQKGDLGLQ